MADLNVTVAETIAGRESFRIPLPLAASTNFKEFADRLSRLSTFPSTNPFTVMFWFRISKFEWEDDATFYGTFFYLAGTDDIVGDSYIWIGYRKEGAGFEKQLYFGSQVTTARSSLLMDPDVWYHVALVRDGTDWSCYIANAIDDVAEDLTTEVIETEINTGTVMQLGNDDLTNISVLNGRLAAVRVYEAALTIEEIRAERAESEAVRGADLWADWRLTDYNDYTDGSGNARHLTNGDGSALDNLSGVTYEAGNREIISVDDVVHAVCRPLVVRKFETISVSTPMMRAFKTPVELGETPAVELPTVTEFVRLRFNKLVVRASETIGVTTPTLYAGRSGTVTSISHAPAPTTVTAPADYWVVGV